MIPVEPKETAWAFLAAMVQGDVDGVDALLADECRVWVAGRLAVSGWKDRAGFMAHLRSAGGGRSSLFDGPVRLQAGWVTAEDDRVCLEAEVHAPLAAGGDYNNQFHFLLRVRDGLVVEVKEYMDTQHLAEVLPGGEPSEHERPSNLTERGPSVVSK